MTYRFELKTPDGRQVRSIVDTYKDAEQPMVFGTDIAHRLMDTQNGCPNIRKELRDLYPQTEIEVVVIDNAREVVVGMATVTPQA